MRLRVLLGASRNGITGCQQFRALPWSVREMSGKNTFDGWKLIVTVRTGWPRFVSRGAHEVEAEPSKSVTLSNTNAMHKRALIEAKLGWKLRLMILPKANFMHLYVGSGELAFKGRSRDWLTGN